MAKRSIDHTSDSISEMVKIALKTPVFPEFLQIRCSTFPSLKEFHNPNEGLCTCLLGTIGLMMKVNYQQLLLNIFYVPGCHELPDFTPFFIPALVKLVVTFSDEIMPAHSPNGPALRHRRISGLGKLLAQVQAPLLPFIPPSLTYKLPYLNTDT